MNRMAIFLFSTSIVAGCTSLSTERQTLDCTALQEVVNLAPSDFESISGARNITRYGDARDVSLHAYGSCSVFIAGGNPALYMCSDRSSEQLNDRSHLIDTVQSCLGDGWNRSELASGGAAFSQENIQVSVGKTDPQASGSRSVGLTVQRIH